MWRLILLCTWFISAHAVAQSNEQPKASATASSSAIESAPNSLRWQLQPEVIALNEQNKLIKLYHSSLLDTVYFALSLVGGVAALLVGGSYLINFKLYESDKERFNEKVHFLKSEIDLLRISQLGLIASLRSEIEANTIAQTEKSKADIVLTVQGQLDTYADRASSEMLGLRTEMSSKAERGENRLLAFEIRVEKVQSMETDLRKKIAFVETLAYRAEAGTYEIRKYFGAQLITLYQATEAAMDADRGWLVKSQMKSIAATLERSISFEQTSSLGDKTLEMLKELAGRADRFAAEESALVLALIARIQSITAASSA